MVGIAGTGKVNISGGAQLNTGPATIGFNGGNGSVTISGTGSHWQTYGSDTTLGTGLIQLDTNATWSDVLSSAYGGSPSGGNVNLSSGATLNVLSGARAHFTTLNEVPGSTLDIGLDGASATLNGQINVDSAANFAGTLDVTLENGFAPAIGESFQLFTFSSDTGTFASLDLPSADTWNTSKLYTQGIITVTAVPEPASAGAMLLFSFATLRRRRTTIH